MCVSTSIIYLNKLAHFRSSEKCSSPYRSVLPFLNIFIIKQPGGDILLINYSIKKSRCKTPITGTKTFEDIFKLHLLQTGKMQISTFYQGSTSWNLQIFSIFL